MRVDIIEICSNRSSESVRKAEGSGLMPARGNELREAIPESFWL